MTQTNRFWKYVLSTLVATLVVITGIVFLLWQHLSKAQSQALRSIAADHPEYFIFILFIILVVLYSVLEVIYTTYIKPLKKISAEAAMIYSSNPSHRLNINGNTDIKKLSSVINDFADLFENLNKNITEQILVARKETEKERNLLAAIMAELPQGVIICNKSGRILLFNSLAKDIFTQKALSTRTEYFIGLGRSIFHLIDKTLIAHAIEEIEERLTNDRQSVASYFITPIHRDHIISVETIPVLDQEKKMTGFILTFQDITEEINQYDKTHETLSALKKDLGSRLRQVETLLDPLNQNQLITDLKSLPHKFDHLTDTILDVRLTKIPLTKIFLTDFLYSLKQKIQSQHDITLHITNQTGNNRMLADTYSFTAALLFLFKTLSDAGNGNEFNISSKRENDTVLFDITWPSAPIKTEFIEQLLSRRINALPSLFYVLKQNKAMLKAICQSPADPRTSQLTIIAEAELKIPTKETHRSPIIAGSRPEFYDFDLFKTDDENKGLLETSLKELTYTVFDTETTGLNPDGGDEIISIAAVRIVNGKIVYKDIFEELVDPKREIPIESYKIHGINYEMVTGKKDINTILPLFKQFTADTVLAGHNIAFDMKMFKVKEKTTHIKFSNPVIDTLLLSAILHPVHEQHDMENIAKRLGINIIGRHTALGDAIATAEIFLKLIPILNSNGILTLKDAVKASRKTYYARLKY